MKDRLNLSLGIPLKNSSSYLPDLLDSLECQTCLPRDIIFADDCSDDDSLKLASTFSERHADWNIHIRKNQRNLGIAGNYNQIVQLASSEWVQILDADDYLYHSDYFAILSSHFDKNCIAIVTGVRSNSGFLNTANILFSALVPETLPEWLPVLGGFATRSGVIYRRSYLLRFDFIDPVFDGSDILHLMYLRMLGTCIYVRNAKVFYRVHPNSETTKTPDDSAYLNFIRRIGNVGKLYYVDYYLRKRFFKFIRMI